MTYIEHLKKYGQTYRVTSKRTGNAKVYTGIKWTFNYEGVKEFVFLNGQSLILNANDYLFERVYQQAVAV